MEEFPFILKAWRTQWRILSQKQCSHIHVLEKSHWRQYKEWIGRALEEEQLGKFCNIQERDNEDLEEQLGWRDI